MHTQHDVAPALRNARPFWRGMARLLLGMSLIAVGAAGATVVSRYARDTPASPIAIVPASLPTMTAAVSSPPTDSEILLLPEAVAQAGIQIGTVDIVEANTSTQLPGSVMADAYREVKVAPIVGGMVTKVHVELGTMVKRGARLVTIFSAELAEAQTKYLALQAMLAADHQKLQRTRQLVEIGAASRQELEEVTAVHASHATEVEAARQRLLLLGLHQAQIAALQSPSQIVSEVMVPAPISGVITSRSANLGQVVSMGQELVVVTDLSQLWVIGDLYEQDFQRVRVGSEAIITTPAYADMRLRGRVSYIDPRLDVQTRTAKVRVEVPNQAGHLRLGMYVTMTFTTRSEHRDVIVPRQAVQALGHRQVVFIPAPDEAGKFVARTVQVGPRRGEFYTVLSGLQPGEQVVTEGSFLLRAEMLRQASSG